MKCEYKLHRFWCTDSGLPGFQHIKPTNINLAHTVLPFQCAAFQRYGSPPAPPPPPCHSCCSSCLHYCCCHRLRAPAPAHHPASSPAGVGRLGSGLGQMHQLGLRLQRLLLPCGKHAPKGLAALALQPVLLVVLLLQQEWLQVQQRLLCGCCPEGSAAPAAVVGGGACGSGVGAWHSGRCCRRQLGPRYPRWICSSLSGR